MITRICRKRTLEYVDVCNIRIAHLNGAKGYEIAKKYKTSQSYISNIITNETFTDANYYYIKSCILKNYQDKVVKLKAYLESRLYNNGKRKRL